MTVKDTFRLNCVLLHLCNALTQDLASSFDENDENDENQYDYTMFLDMEKIYIRFYRIDYMSVRRLLKDYIRKK